MRAALVVAALLVAAPATAGPPRATAVELFDRGRALAASGKCAEAVPFFLDTLKIEPSIGALLNLAECEEKLGRRFEAYDHFRAAASLARDRADDRETLARSRAESLAELLPKLAVVAPDGVRVRVDDRDARGTIVVAPGDHVVRASAPGKRDWQTTVHATAATTTVAVPELAPLVTFSPPAPRDGRAQRTAGLVVTLAGGAGLAVSGVLAGIAAARRSDAAALATGPSEAAFDAARADAASFADASTAVFVAGAVLATAGLVVWLTSPRVRVAVSPGPSAWLAMVGGSF